MQYITNSAFSSWVSTKYASPFLRHVEFSIKTGAEMRTDCKYRIQNVNSGLYLEAADIPASGVNVQQGTNKAASLWVLKDAGDGYYYIGFTTTVDGKNYWVAYQWESKKSATLTLDMNKPFEVSEIIGTETEAVTDETVIGAITEKLKKEKSALLQAWYACDKTGKQIDPAEPAVSLKAYVLSGDAADTTTTTTAPSENENTDRGDANCDGEINMADAVRVMQAIANPDKYALYEKGTKNADVDGSGDVTNMDALIIQQFKLGLISSLSVSAA